MKGESELKVKTFKESLEGRESRPGTKDEIRDAARIDVLAFINKEIGQSNLVSLTECRSQTYWECTVWYWEESDQQQG